MISPSPGIRLESGRYPRRGVRVEVLFAHMRVSYLCIIRSRRKLLNKIHPAGCTLGCIRWVGDRRGLQKPWRKLLKVFNFSARWPRLLQRRSGLFGCPKYPLEKECPCQQSLFAPRESVSRFSKPNGVIFISPRKIPRYFVQKCCAHPSIAD